MHRLQPRRRRRRISSGFQLPALHAAPHLRFPSGSSGLDLKPKSYCVGPLQMLRNMMLHKQLGFTVRHEGSLCNADVKNNTVTAMLLLLLELINHGGEILYGSRRKTLAEGATQQRDQQHTLSRSSVLRVSLPQTSRSMWIPAAERFPGKGCLPFCAWLRPGMVCNLPVACRLASPPSAPQRCELARSIRHIGPLRSRIPVRPSGAWQCWPALLRSATATSAHLPAQVYSFKRLALSSHPDLLRTKSTPRAPPPVQCEFVLRSRLGGSS